MDNPSAHEVFRHLRLPSYYRLFFKKDKIYLENTRIGVVKEFEWRKYVCDCCNGTGFKPRKQYLLEEMENFELE